MPPLNTRARNQDANLVPICKYLRDELLYRFLVRHIRGVYPGITAQSLNGLLGLCRARVSLREEVGGAAVQLAICMFVVTVK